MHRSASHILLLWLVVGLRNCFPELFWSAPVDNAPWKSNELRRTRLICIWEVVWRCQAKRFHLSLFHLGQIKITVPAFLGLPPPLKRSFHRASSYSTEISTNYRLFPFFQSRPLCALQLQTFCNLDEGPTTLLSFLAFKAKITPSAFWTDW